jgi:CheY-like chemotaxis protein
LSAQIWVDSDRIVQTLMNLLSNAIKFSPSGSTVELSAEWQSNQILFRVRDRGRGIPADQLDRIFERFQQVDASDSRNNEGTGLGLAICRSIVQQHSGQIWVESRVDEGSTFSFTLPTPQSSRLSVLSLRPESSPTADISPHSTPLVLVCDDDAAIRKMLQLLLEQQGYRVMTAASGQAAIASSIAHSPDVILLDLQMPNMDGWEVIDALRMRSETQNIPVVICSVCTPYEKPIPAPKPVGWVTKPINEQALLQSLEQALSHASRRMQVLVVEDDMDLANVLMMLFDQHNIKAFHAKTGEEAIRQSQRLSPSLLVLDLILPDRDGFAVVEWMRQHLELQNLPLVVYSAKDLDQSERDRLQLGKTEFLTKGQVTLQAFEQRVLELLQQMMITPGETPL